MAHSTTDGDTLHVLVTGVNSGLGFGTCCRLIDEFLDTRPASSNLNLIITTRDERKSSDSIRRITSHLEKTVRSHKHAPASSSRVSIQPEFLDLTNLTSCRKLAGKLVADDQKLDVVILNAGMGGFLGLNYLGAARQALTDIVGAFTWPTYKLGSVGWVTKPQLLRKTSDEKDADADADAEPPLGEVFCANVFGHYLLVHDLMPLLRRDANEERTRVIWTSSLEAYDKSFDLADMQAIRTSTAYESSKRLTDILALTYETPAAEPYVSAFTSTSTTASSANDDAPPKQYVTHPGICASKIMFRQPGMSFVVSAILCFIRLFGSIWQTADPYLGATAPVWLALAPRSVLDNMEAAEGKGKWGSATDVWGNERVERTEVEGYGYGGVVGDAEKGGKRKGRWKGAKELTEEGRRAFDELGARCWGEMEGLREEWVERLDAEA